eukprot:gnl/Dysnectes_brevis/1174_a1310_2746.p2 GENE.gnl/Dysnectes_brevis/1174_a1310_2746~~gnl/Dysnectes_brevis/1174_a1310_2746.p2  ORF type:complete len:201 (-),score=54.17 gnl/Dysnectes_brevis/1174_a1310_2746:51-653(-)
MINFSYHYFKAQSIFSLMFGCIVSGRPMTTAFQQISDTQFVMSVPDLATAQHVTVFILEPASVPTHLGVGVYFTYPGMGEEGMKYQGCLLNGSPSATFKVQMLSIDSEETNITGTLGLMIEPVEELGTKQQTSIHDTTVVQHQTLNQVGKKMLADIHSYLASHSIQREGESYVPYRAIKSWMSSFDRRIRYSTRFWSTVE